MAHEVKLGALIDENQQRDAIHVAVAPVIAADGEKLYPGQDIGFVGDDSIHVGAGGQHLGIVDPFLKRPVYQGDRFWMLLYPNSITSLRHDWLHPAFQSADDGRPTRIASEKWLREFCNTHDCPDYETVVAAAVNTDDTGYLHFDGEDAHGVIPPEFWMHIETVTGRKLRYKPEYFSCSC